MIYLHTNFVYGEPFIRTAAKLSRSRQFGVTLVFSERKPAGEASAESWWSRLRWRLHVSRRQLRLRRRLGLPVIVTSDVNGSRLAARIGPGSHGVIAGFNQIFKKPAIDRFRSIVNFHPSVLPYYRGPVPSYWCIRNKEKFSGFSLHQVTEKIDAGETLWQEIVPIGAADDAESLTRRIGEQAQVAFEKYLLSLVEDKPLPRRLVDAESVYATPVGYRSFPKKSKTEPSA